MPKTKERHFEDAIEHDLVTRGGWAKGDPTDFDRRAALVPNEFLAFVEATQKPTLDELRKHHPGLEVAVLETLAKALDARGALDVLRHGFKFFGKKLECAYFQPPHGMNPDTLARYAQNRLTVTRQVKFIVDHDDSVDLALFVNGVPVATAELKNPLTNQTVEHAVRQYRDRDPRHPLFRFKARALVHFAVDPDVVYMTTKLAGQDTVFLPLNRGHQSGAGNPDHPSGYRTGYLWQELWSRDSFLDILGRFAHLAVDERTVDGKVVSKETLVFPRYHQLDVVRKVEQAARRDGAGRSYLIQHSAGSGKSNSIAWLAHRLASLHDANDKRVFDSVVVVTDRRVLDQQLQRNIYQFEHKQGVVQKIDESSQQLADALSSGTPIVITTLQKFPFVTEKIGKLPKRRYALIVDEAHSSQTGEAARTMKEVLAVKDLAEAESEDAGAEEDAEDRLVKVMESRGKQKNLSFFAFTADLDGDVALRYYRLDKLGEGSITLSLAENVALRAPTDVGTKKANDVDASLSEIIDVLNEKFGTEFTGADQLLFDQFVAEAKLDEGVRERALANRLDNFELAMKPKVEGLMMDRMEENQEIVNRYLNDPEFQATAFKSLVRRIYREIRHESERPGPLGDIC